jgi:hypothetical protein
MNAIRNGAEKVAFARDPGHLKKRGVIVFLPAEVLVR